MNEQVRIDALYTVLVSRLGGDVTLSALELMRAEKLVDGGRVWVEYAPTGIGIIDEDERPPAYRDDFNLSIRIDAEDQP